MKKVEVIKVRKGTYSSIACPYCHSSNVIEIKRPIEKKIEQTDDRGYPITQETYNEASDCTCNECSEKYMIDYGENVYSVYKSPLSQNTLRDILCLAKFEGEWHENFEIFVAKVPNNTNKGNRKIYFIKYESDPQPIFITKAQADKFTKNAEEAGTFAYCHYMTRYR